MTSFFIGMCVDPLYIVDYLILGAHTASTSKDMT